MKKSIVIILFLSITAVCNAQTWNEWFQQKKTQIKYLEEQIVALQLYGNYLKKGYDIVQGGLSAIHDIKQGDFDIHNNHFSALKRINPAIANSSKAGGVITLQLQILQLNSAVNRCLSAGALQNEEKAYIRRVMNNVLDKCTDDLAQLTLLTTGGAAQLNDDERLERIEWLYKNMQDKYVFTLHFREEVQLLSLSRIKASDDISALKLLYNLK